MKTINKELYEYSDIIKAENSELLEVILQNLSDINTDMDWYDFIFDDLKEELEKIGLTDVEINFSGFWSQGDGASFTCTCFDIKKLLNHFRIDTRHVLAFIEDTVTIEIVRKNSHYYHENSTAVETLYSGLVHLSKYKRFDKKLDTVWMDLTHDMENYRRLKSIELYKRLKDCHEDLTSRESILETIESMEYTFNSEGKIES